MDNRIYAGPSMPLSQEIDSMKYRQEDESFDGKIKRIANALADDAQHKLEMEEILGEMRFLPAGRVQSAIGAARITTAYNCFVSGTIDDNMNSIMERASEAAETMRRGGGIGYDSRIYDHVVGRLSRYNPRRLALLVLWESLTRSVRQSALQDIDEVRRWACLEWIIRISKSSLLLNVILISLLASTYLLE